MYYMIEVGYQRVLLETDRLVPDSVFAVSLKTVDGVAMYVIESTPDVSVHLIPGRKIIFPGTKEEQDCFRNLYAEIEKDRDEYRSRAWKAEDEIKKLRKEKESKDD